MGIFSFLITGGIPAAAADYILLLAAVVWLPPFLLEAGGLLRLARKARKRWAGVLGVAALVASAGNLVLTILLLNLRPALAQYDYALQESVGCRPGYPCDTLPLPADLLQAWHRFTQIVGLATWWLLAGYIIFLLGLMGLRRDWKVPHPASAVRP